MSIKVKRALRLLPAAALAFAALALPAFAGAQPSYAVHEDTIHGTVSHFDGQYTMYINDDRGFMDRISLHPGTVINPTGIRLESGFAVTIIGHPAGDSFIANEIDTPYQYYYGHRYGYGYPYYGPAIGVGFGFGYPYYGHYGRGWYGWR
jgi:hypothetical protein